MMRYVPNLIPDSSRVLPDYFEGNIYKVAEKNPIRDTIFWIIGILFFIAALVSFRHPIMILFFGLIGLILAPHGKQFLEQKLRFRLTPKIRMIATLALFIGAVPLKSHYADVDKKIAYEQKLTDEKAAQEKAIADKKEQQRKDSLTFYITKGNYLAKEHKFDEANKQFQHAMVFASLPTDKEQIEKEKIEAASIKAFDLVKVGKYQAALPEINSLLNATPSNSALIYNRALCYSKIGKIQEAVNDLKPLIQSGNAEAERLNNRINPIRKRIIGYETLCCDGTTSNARGSGACSHHGGVCNWNHPIYEESRKYE